MNQVTSYSSPTIIFCFWHCTTTLALLHCQKLPTIHHCLFSKQSAKRVLVFQFHTGIPVPEMVLSLNWTHYYYASIDITTIRKSQIILSLNSSRFYCVNLDWGKSVFCVLCFVFCVLATIVSSAYSNSIFR